MLCNSLKITSQIFVLNCTGTSANQSVLERSSNNRCATRLVTGNPVVTELLRGHQ